ncbi:hypothetical protein BB561_002231 [Smittium simulii]|uniref:Uncharacterized protein n=1 Tax=Smittium simulii TaxID=133385 RepID=A0A2T9YR74_9FUNG|nr:hypothetical protein BB561_002231 [Smittium simulii]
MVRLRQELSLTNLNIKTAVARTRAFGKCASLRTWISDLIKCPYKHRCDTWVSGCARWIKKYNGNINKIKNTIETLNNRQKKNDKSQISKWIADTEAGTSCNWMGLELTARRYAKSGFIEKRLIEECSFCRNIAPESTWRYIKSNLKYKKTTTTKTAIINMELELIAQYKKLAAMIRIRQYLSIYSSNKTDLTKICANRK